MPTGQNAGVRLRNISKTFPGGTQAVDDISLDIQPGEVFTLLGPQRLRKDDDASDGGRPGVP